ncbi:hypothetical protein JCM16303_006675 [Sporobolomyces ruberrimus]
MDPSPPSPAPPSLNAYISSHLSSTLPGTHTFSLQSIRSQPRRSYALFPHATNHKSAKIWQEEVLSILSISQTATSKENEQEVVKGFVPLCAIEASIYTIPSTSTSILYISKVDTTGLQRPPTSPSSPSPTKSFVSAFLSYHFLFPPHSTTRLRVHVFARSQSQYLFPGSADNTTSKRILSDKELSRWWKSTLESATLSYESATRSRPLPTSSSSSTLKKFYLIPGLSYLESLPYVPNLPTSSTSPWTYSHPYSTLPSPLFPPPSPPTINTSPPTDSELFSLPNQIPSFPDDPKSRFLHSLTSSSLSPSGSPGDYDDLHSQLSSLTFTSGSNYTPQQRMVEVEKERERERERLLKGVEGGTEEWWERMQFRQECCSGVLVGFFVVALEPTTTTRPSSISDVEQETTTTTTTTLMMKNHAPVPYPSSLPHSTFTKLWTQFHNQDYSLPALSLLIPAIKKWTSDVTRLVKLEEEGQVGGEGKDVNEEVEMGCQVRNENLLRELIEKREKKRRSAEGGVDGTAGGGLGGGGEGEGKKVNTLAPRKKKKVA